MISAKWRSMCRMKSMSFLIRSNMTRSKGGLSGWAKKRQAANTACRKGTRNGSDVGLGLAEALDAIAGLPQAALPQKIDPLEAFQDVAFDDETRGALKAFVL